MSFDTKERLREIQYVANKLTDREFEVAELTRQFRIMSDEITQLTGLELWHTDSDGGKYFWMHKGDRKTQSKEYNSRGEAILMLIEDRIEW